MMSGHDLSVNNDTTAYTCSKCYHYHIGGACCSTLPCFSQCRYIGVISGFSMKACKFFHLSNNILISPVEIYCTCYFSFGVYRSRNTDSDAFHILFGDTLFFHLGIYCCCHIRKNLISIIFFTGGNLPFLNKSTIRAEKSAFYSCSTYIDSKTICSHFLPSLILRHPDFLFFSQDLPVHACTEPLPHCIPSSSVCG